MALARSGRRADIHLDVAQLVVERAQVSNRPPVVEKNLDRAPHRHPTADEQALLYDFVDGAGTEAGDEFARAQAGGQEQEADEQAGPPLAQLAPQLSVG